MDHNATVSEGFKFLFLTANGRIGRKWFWIGSLLPLLFIAAGSFLIWSVAPPAEDAAAKPIFIALFVIIFLLGLVASFAVAIKRLHDRNKSGWWLLLFYWLPGVADKLTDRVAEGSPAWWLLLLAGLTLSLWGLIEMGFLKGTDGPNDYGSDPLKQ